MPPFNGFNGPSFKFSSEAVAMLWDAGHRKKLAIVDASYNIPDGGRVGRYGGSSADALRAVIEWVPLDKDEEEERPPHGIVAIRNVLCMAPDPPDTTCEALEGFREVAKEFPGIDIDSLPRLDEHVPEEAKGGWYSRASDPSQTIYLKTVGRLAYECALVTIGHSQT